MSYSNGLLSDQSYQTANKYVQRGLPGVGFKLTDTGDYDMQNKKLVNVDEGENNQDVVNKHQLDVGLQTKPNKTDVLLLDGTSHMVGDLDLRGNKIILPGEIQMDRKLITNLDTDENQDLSAVNMITLKNKVEPKADKDYVDFEITKQNALINNTFVKKTGDQMNGDLILPHDSYPVDGNTNKAISYETQREIFLSRRESFPMLADINMNNNFIQNVATPTTSHQVTNKGYCDYNFLNRQKGGVLMGPLSMNRNDLTGIPDTPKFGYSAVNKNYVDGEITKINTSSFLKLDGSRAMIGDLDLGTNIIKNVKLDLNDDTTAFPLSTLKHHETSTLRTFQVVNTELQKKLNLSGGIMTGDLNLDSHKIIDLKDPINSTDAANKKYIDEKLLKSHLLSAKVENAFKYLSDVDESATESNIYVHGIVDFNGSPHKNKKAYDIDMVYSLGSQNYISKLGINLYPLAVTGKYTMIMEYYYPEDLNIIIYAEVTKTTTIKKQVKFNETNHKKYLVQFDFPSKDYPPHYIYFTIRGSGTTSTNPEGYLIFYGVKGWDDNVPPEIYDYALETGMFEYDNGNMKIYHDIDMNNHRITNLSDGTDKNDAVNMSQLIAVKTQSDKMNSIFDKFRFYLPNYSYLNFFTYRFYDFTKPNKFIISRLSDSHRISGLNPNLFISGSKSITLTQFIPNQGLLFNSSIKIIIALNYSVTQTSPFTMMISMILKDNLKLYFVEPTQENIAYYPVFIIDKIQSQLSMETLANLFRYQPYSSDFNEKQIMVWIGYNYSLNIYEISIGNADKLIFNAPSIPPSAFKTSKIRIDPGKNIIKRICYENSYKSHDEDYLKIVLEEKKNGSHFN